MIECEHEMVHASELNVPGVMNCRPGRLSVQLVAVACVVAASVLLLLAMGPTRDNFHFARQTAAVPVQDDRIKVLFVRESIGTFSPEYTQRLILMRESRIVSEFVLPDDAGGAPTFLVSKNSTQPSLILFANQLGEFLIDLDAAHAFRVFHSAEGDLLPQYCPYKPGFPGAMDPVSTFEELDRLKELSIDGNPIETNSPLSELCVDAWEPICVVDGTRGRVRIREPQARDILGERTCD